MTFRYVTERTNYSDYSSGRVFYNLPGYPAFPIRLASEIFQRCLGLRAVKGKTAPVRLYDPCCGGAYHLAVLALLHWHQIQEISASDIDQQALSIAARNLVLLTLPGLDHRIGEIVEMESLYKKESHRDAKQSAEIIKEKLGQLIPTRTLPVELFQADALNGDDIQCHFGMKQIDLVITDIPYGVQSQWVVPNPEDIKEPTWQLLENLQGVLANEALVAISSTKQIKISHEDYRQVGKLKTGKRQVVILENVNRGFTRTEE